MLIDSCASGGGRNDLETMHRSVPLHYSDHFDGGDEALDDKHAMSQILYQWFPYFKNQLMNKDMNMYRARTNYSPWLMLQFLSEDVPLDILKKAIAEYSYVRDFFFADFYLLTEIARDGLNYCGWEFYDHNLGKGFALLFRPEGSSHDSQFIKLYGLEDGFEYELSDFDNNTSLPNKKIYRADGSSLKNGFTVSLSEPMSSTLIAITKIR